MKTKQETLSNLFESLSLMHRALLTHKHSSLQKLGMTRPQIELLFYLDRHGEVTMKEITPLMHVTSSAMTQLVEGLVKLHYVIRAHDSMDRRVVKIHLTKQGAKRLHAFRESLFEQMALRLKGLSDQELKTMSELARKIADNTSDHK